MTYSRPTPLLDRVTWPRDFRNFSLEQLAQLSDEVRLFLINTVAKTGGHFASGLGTVELTVALHHVFDTPKDLIVWDVGHQTYPHKILTGRKDRLATIRQKGGLSGFTNRTESEYDVFNAAHASTAISAALGMAVARDYKGEGSHVIAVIGDGALTGGVAMEGLNQAGYLKRKLIVILNDNDMSISPNVGAISGYLLRIARGQIYNRVRADVAAILKKLPGGDRLAGFAEHLEDGLKKALVPGTLFEELGFEYMGPIDGHSIPVLVRTLKEARAKEGPVLLHVRTVKGKGYELAEKDPVFWHGPSPFKVETGEIPKKSAPPSYTTTFAETLISLGEKDERIVGITAAMPEGTGIDLFAKRFPSRAFDVGICEQHAVLFAAGMATQGYKPVCAIYSTFLQRAYDQIMHDVCLMDLPVVFALDRGGLVGADGPTHHGAFDLTYLRVFPNMQVGAPKDENELRQMIAAALESSHPTAVRYPRGNGWGVAMDPEIRPLSIGKAEVLRIGKDGVVLAIGDPVIPSLRAAEKLAASGGPSLTVINARWVKPMDREVIAQFVKPATKVVTVEENALAGGFGAAVLEVLEQLDIAARVRRLGIPDRFVPHGTQAELRHDLGLDEEGLLSSFRDHFEGKKAGVVPLAPVSRAS
ncbi:MAG: 1-deoxy-D-xylulose-5-phosphate synthase [Thermoanaerobaculia bacterium]|nr:1-deoxy-D-xylulose-5-phosphate synthase [Thermoanaerobaculia bacterium]